MGRAQAVEMFWLVVADEDRALFAVVGPLVDDALHIDRVCRAQDAGRRIRCFPHEGHVPRDALIESLARRLRLRYTEEELV